MEVWLLQRRYPGEESYLPYLIYASKQSMFDNCPTINWELEDSDVCRGFGITGDFYATKWPVHD